MVTFIKQAHEGQQQERGCYLSMRIYGGMNVKI